MVEIKLASHLNSELITNLFPYQHPVASEGRFDILAQILSFLSIVKTIISPFARPVMSVFKDPDTISIEASGLNSHLIADSQP